ncbi:unnamed protein product [Symbiodinium sp. CCMP2592]|nr:unnamed protein product [Symbiodinium sp. CCMP2592]
MAALDRALDSDPCANHKFLEQQDTFIARKVANPSMRIGKLDTTFQAEQVDVMEAKTQGFKKPKRKFMALDVYEAKYGAADPTRIKTQKIDGTTVKGIDIIEESDIGIYEYIDETTSSVTRTTSLSNPDLILSKDQTTTIFNAVAKQMTSAPKDDTTCTVIPGSSASSSGMKAPTDFAGGGGAEKDPLAKAKPAPAKPSGSKVAASAAKSKGSTRNKRATDPDSEPVLPPKATRTAAEPKTRPGPGQRPDALSRDDEDNLAKFTEQVNGFLELQAVDAEDDAAFTSWSKDKLQAMTLLKIQISNKKKSLNRRSNKDNTNLIPELDELVVKLNTIIDFVRKLSAGTVEGRRLYDAMGEIHELNVCTTIWKRILRAVAFDALKLAQWDSFFGETHALCVEHGFVVAAIDHAAKTLSTGWTAEDHLDFLKSIKDVVDFSTPPAVIKNAIARLKTDEGDEKHWAASSFQLPHGKKLFEAATANAVHKESQAGVLDVLHQAEERMTTSAICTFEASFMMTVRSWFDAGHGDMLSETLQRLTNKKMKVLKGVDKDKLDRVLQMARTGAVAVILAFVNNELVPYMNTWSTDLRDKQSSTDGVMSSSTCVMHLTDASGHGQEALIGMLKDIDAFMSSTSEKLRSSETSPENLSTLPTTWAVKTKAMSASLAACVAKAQVGEKGDDLVDRVKSAVADAGSALAKVLQDGVQDDAWASVLVCVTCLVDVVTEGKAKKELLTGEFPEAVESAKLYSTILGDEVGASVLAGIEAISTFVTAMVSVTSLDQLVAAGDPDEQTMETQSHELIRTARKLDELTVEKLTTSVSELNKENIPISSETLSKVGSICQQLIERGQHEFAKITKTCQDRLSKSFIADSDVDIPEFVHKMESYDQLDGEIENIKKAFDLTVAGNISSQTTDLGSTIDCVKELATSLEVDASEIVELTKFETSYRNGIRWMGTCNILYLLISKAVSRAVLAGSKPSQKAIVQFTDATKVCSDQGVELPAGLQALITKVIRAEESDAQPAQPKESK